MKTCDWCGESTPETYQTNSLGNTYHLCKKCKIRYTKGVCRVCNGPIGNNAINGICLLCFQTGNTEEDKVKEEKSAGVDFESTHEYSTESEFTEEDFNDWMTFGQGNFSPQKRTENRRKWLYKKLCGKDNWTEALIDIYLPSLEKIIDKHFDKLLGDQYKIVMVTGNESFRPGSIVCIEKNVAIINTKI